MQDFIEIEPMLPTPCIGEIYTQWIS